METHHPSPSLTTLSHDLICNILKYLSVREVLAVGLLCKKLSIAVNMHFRLCKTIDFCPHSVDDYMPSSINDDHLHALFRKCPQLEYVYGLHPWKIERRRFRRRSSLTVPGVIDALSLCFRLKAIETCDLRLLEAVLQHLPQIEIIGHFQNRDYMFPPHASQKLKLQPYTQITSLHLISVEVPELTAMPHLRHLHLQCIKFTKLQPFRAFLVLNLRSFVMKNCIGPSMSLSYLSLIIALSSAVNLNHLELVRVPLPGGLFQRAVEDTQGSRGFCNLKTLVVSGCKGVLEVDIGHLMIVASKKLETLFIQPSLTKDSLFVSLSYAHCSFPNLRNIHLGYIDSFNYTGEWSNETLVSMGLAEVPDTPSSITDSGMKVIGQLLPQIKSLSVSNCPHLMNMFDWLTEPREVGWQVLTDLTLQKCHCLQLSPFSMFVTWLPSIQVIILYEMFKEPPKGCSHVGLSAGTGLGMSSAVVSNQDEHLAVQGHPVQEFDHPAEEEADIELEIVDPEVEENQEPHFMVLRGDFFEEDDDADYMEYENHCINEAVMNRRNSYFSDDSSDFDDDDNDPQPGDLSLSGTLSFKPTKKLVLCSRDSISQSSIKSDSEQQVYDPHQPSTSKAGMYLVTDVSDVDGFDIYKNSEEQSANQNLMSEEARIADEDSKTVAVCDDADRASTSKAEMYLVTDMSEIDGFDIYKDSEESSANQNLKSEEAHIMDQDSKTVAVCDDAGQPSTSKTFTYSVTDVSEIDGFDIYGGSEELSANQNLKSGEAHITNEDSKTVAVHDDAGQPSISKAGMYLVTDVSDFDGSDIYKDSEEPPVDQNLKSDEAHAMDEDTKIVAVCDDSGFSQISVKDSCQQFSISLRGNKEVSHNPCIIPVSKSIDNEECNSSNVKAESCMLTRQKKANTKTAVKTEKYVWGDPSVSVCQAPENENNLPSHKGLLNSRHSGASTTSKPYCVKVEKSKGTDESDESPDMNQKACQSSMKSINEKNSSSCLKVKSMAKKGSLDDHAASSTDHKLLMPERCKNRKVGKIAGKKDCSSEVPDPNPAISIPGSQEKVKKHKLCDSNQITDSFSDAPTSTAQAGLKLDPSSEQADESESKSKDGDTIPCCVILKRVKNHASDEADVVEQAENPGVSLPKPSPSTAHSPSVELAVKRSSDIPSKQTPKRQKRSCNTSNSSTADSGSSSPVKKCFVPVEKLQSSAQSHPGLEMDESKSFPDVMPADGCRVCCPLDPNVPSTSKSTCIHSRNGSNLQRATRSKSQGSRTSHSLRSIKDVSEMPSEVQSAPTTRASTKNQTLKSRAACRLKNQKPSPELSCFEGRDNRNREAIKINSEDAAVLSQNEHSYVDTNVKLIPCSGTHFDIRPGANPSASRCDICSLNARNRDSEESFSKKGPKFSGRKNAQFSRKKHCTKSSGLDKKPTSSAVSFVSQGSQANSADIRRSVRRIRKVAQAKKVSLPSRPSSFKSSKM